MSTGKRRYRFEVEYDGSAFHGWQVQLGLRSVQGDLEAAFSALLQEKVTVYGAGRTDSGVHALGQVAHINTAREVVAAGIEFKVNGFLKRDVAVRKIRRAKPDFHSRHSATARVYRYHLAFRKSPLTRGRSWYTRAKVDLPLLKFETRRILGEHDFKSFCARSSRHEDTVCVVRRADWKSWPGGIFLELEANRFVHHMIRNLVGTLVPMSQGRWPGPNLTELLQSGDRTLAGATAPARGLCLVRVHYRPRPALGA